MRRVFIGLAALSLAACATTTTVERPDTPLVRTQLLALLQTLNATLLSQPSATLTLEHWCADHALASPARIVALRGTDATKPITVEDRAVLAIAADEPVRYRRVRLACGTHVLSEADNWYVPSRLTPAMNATLDTTDVPFGKAVQALDFKRRTLSAELLWSPLPDGWEMRGPPPSNPGATLAIPREVLRHRAVLTRADGAPFSLVVETYSSTLLAFPLTGR